MTILLPILAALSAPAAQPPRMVGCDFDGFRFVLIDKTAGLTLVTDDQEQFLPRDQAMTTPAMHVASDRRNGRALSIVLTSRNHVTMTLFDPQGRRPITQTDGQCEAI